MAISSITRSDGANYAFQINLDTAFAEARPFVGRYIRLRARSRLP